MIRTYTSVWRSLPIVIGVALLALFVMAPSAGAIEKISDPKPNPGSFGLEATKKQAPPTQGATITTPGNGAAFTNSPITVSGICPTGLLVQVYDNGVLVGSVMCASGSFSIQVSLFAGTNDLSAIVYDDLDQAGPTSNIVPVTYTDSRLTAFGQLVTLTSAYGRRSSPAGSELTWPMQLTGGTGPYAFSLDWGDGSKTELKSQSVAGAVTIAHAYKKAGIYQMNVRVADVNGVSAFLQVIAVSNGKVDEAAAGAGASGNTADKNKTVILWAPAAVALVLLIPTYWLGRRSQIISIHNKMLKERDSYEDT